MKVEIEIPDPKFQVGDVLQYGPGKLILYVQSKEARGEWGCRNEARPYLDWDGDWRYGLVVQAGGGLSSCKKSLETQRNPMKPVKTFSS